MIEVYKAAYCNAVRFFGGQMLIHERSGHISIEISPADGWKMARPRVEANDSGISRTFLTLVREEDLEREKKRKWRKKR